MTNDCRTVMLGGKCIDGMSCVKCGGPVLSRPYRHGIEDNKHEPKQEPLLQIVLSDIDAAPDVYYKGDKVTGKIRVSFDWATDTDKVLYMTYIHIEHADPDDKRLNTKVIQHNHPLKVKE
uniref:hypothetical protein n=1 Tax=Bacillus cytotoxicus TaxID=580165 RepID=UPI00203CF560